MAPGSSLLASLAQMASSASMRDLSEGHNVESERGRGTCYCDLCMHKHGLKHAHTYVHVPPHTLHHMHALNNTEIIPILVSLCSETNIFTVT